LADFQRGRPALVAEALRIAAKHGIWPDHGSLADGRAAIDDDMALELDTVMQHRAGMDMAERTDAHAGTEFGAGFDNRGRMNVCHHAAASSAGPRSASMAVMVASETTAPLTRASPAKRQTLPRWRSLRTCMCRQSPGTTGLRNFA